jgi:hypothetical protein
MANTLYPLWKKLQLDGASKVDFDSDTIKFALLKVTGTGAVAYNAAHDFYDDVSSGVVGTPQTLTTKTTTAGKFTSDPAVFTAVSSAGNTLGGVLYKDTGTPGTSPIIAYYDTGTNVPATPNGSDITVTPDGTNGWFTL